jgi:hypothetical protein
MHPIVWPGLCPLTSGSLHVGCMCVACSWHNHLNPDIIKSPWTEEEDRIIMDKHVTLGNQWAKIAEFLPGRCVHMLLGWRGAAARVAQVRWLCRTDNAIKNHWNSSMRKRLGDLKPGSKPEGSSPMTSEPARAALAGPRASLDNATSAAPVKTAPVAKKSSMFDCLVAVVGYSACHVCERAGRPKRSRATRATHDDFLSNSDLDSDAASTVSNEYSKAVFTFSRPASKRRLALDQARLAKARAKAEARAQTTTRPPPATPVTCGELFDFDVGGVDVGVPRAHDALVEPSGFGQDVFELSGLHSDMGS